MNAKNSNVQTASAHETGIATQEMCREFIALVKQNYPQLKRVKVKKRGKRYCIQGGIQVQAFVYMRFYR
ncbi:MAG: hypothetical protein LBJ63_06740 [Prevotellaceae bacterium]|nr:hypothetical protein [Prevotellaceae bacterium]